MLIAVTSQATRVTPADVGNMCRAVAHQLRYHAGPAWEKHAAAVVYYPDAGLVPPGADLLAVFDDADQAGALGYHDETPDGHPYGKVFAGTTLDAGGTPVVGTLTVGSVLSHEALELFVDPTCHTWDDDGAGKLYAREVGDPVESDSYQVAVRQADGTVLQVAVSNFVTPAWFDSQAPAGSRFDWMGTVKAPFAMSAGGYVIVGTEAGVTQQFGAAYPDWRRAAKQWPAARTWRRGTQLGGSSPSQYAAADQPRQEGTTMTDEAEQGADSQAQPDGGDVNPGATETVAQKDKETTGADAEQGSTGGGQ